MNAVEAPAQPTSMEQSLQQLRVLVCGLMAGLLLVSAALSFFVWKQNRNLRAQTNARLRQVEQLRGTARQFELAMNELAKYSRGKPELLAILARHGMQLVDSPAPAAP